jgi:N-acetylmuramoyl-L-alanine amidase
MRKINRLVIHCTATTIHTSVDAILNYFKKVKGWRSYGYHYLVDYTGKGHNITPIEEIANGAKGYNEDSIHIAYIGGIDNFGKPKDTRTDRQKQSLVAIVTNLKKQFPDAEIVGHRELPNVAKACPCFSVAKEFSYLNQ